MKALLTGAGGFIGRQLAAFLSSQGILVRAMGPRSSSLPSYKLADFTSAREIKEVLAAWQPNYIFHLAGVARNDEPQEFYKVNVLYASALLEAVEQSPGECRAVMLMGSAAEYGPVDAKSLPIDENQHPRPSTHYGISKLAQTLTGLAALSKGVPSIIVRPFNLIGPGMPPFIALQEFASQIAAIRAGVQEPVIRTMDLSASRDFVDIRDAIEVLWILVRNPQAVGKIVNLCSGQSYCIADLLNRLIQVADVKARIEQRGAAQPAFGNSVSYGSTERLESLAGRVPRGVSDDLLKEILASCDERVRLSFIQRQANDSRLVV